LRNQKETEKEIEGKEVNNGRKCEIEHVGIPGRYFFAGLRFSHQLLLPSGHTFHITPLSLCMIFFLFFFILTFVIVEIL